MANQRIKDIPDTATSAASDDYLVIDGATNGTRRISADRVGGGEYTFTSTITPSVDSRGVGGLSYNVTPTDSASLTVDNALKIKAYLLSGTSVVYPLIIPYVTVNSTAFYITVKSIYGSTQSTSSSTVSGTLKIVAPFEISNVSTGM